MIAHAKEKETDAAAAQGRQVQEAPVTGGPLSARELHILFARARGLSNKEIAFELGISAHTVSAVLARVRAKLNL